MTSPTPRILPVALICLWVLVGCDASDNAEVTQAQAELAKAKEKAEAAEAELAKMKAAPAQPKPAEIDRRAAEWVLRVDGSVQVVVDGIAHTIKTGEQLPDGEITLLAISLGNCPKASDDGRDYLRGLTRLRELAINGESSIRNFDFLPDMVNLQVLNMEGGQICFSDKDLIHLKGLKQLKTLIVISQFKNNPDLTDMALEVAKELKQLEDLRIACCNVTDAGLRHLEGHESLRSLGFWRTQISDAGLDSLAKLPKLNDVYLGGTLVTDAGVKSLQVKKPMCQIRR